jgi:hypothetical protein
VSDDLLIHIGHGDDRKTYAFDPNKLLNTEYIAIERAAQLTVSQLGAGLSNGSLTAVTAIVWVLRKRDEPRLQFGEVLFTLDECEIEDPDDEVPAAPKAAKKAARKS